MLQVVLFGNLCCIACRWIAICTIFTLGTKQLPSRCALDSKPVAYWRETIQHLPPIMRRKPWTQFATVVTGFATLLIMGHHTLLKVIRKFRQCFEPHSDPSCFVFDRYTSPNKLSLALKSSLTDEMIVFFIAPKPRSLKLLRYNFESRPESLNYPSLVT